MIIFRPLIHSINPMTVDLSTVARLPKIDCVSFCDMLLLTTRTLKENDRTWISLRRFQRYGSYSEQTFSKIMSPLSLLRFDKQLYPFRGYVPKRSYMPSKLAKYGTIFFWICDARDGYASNRCLIQEKSSMFVKLASQSRSSTDKGLLKFRKKRLHGQVIFPPRSGEEAIE